MSSNKIFNVVMLILMISALGSTIFGANGLANTNFTASAPAWVVTLLVVGTGIALVKLIIGSD